MREGALEILATYGAKEQVPVLVRALKTPISNNVRHQIVQALGRLKDPRAIKPLAALLAEGSVDQFGYVNGRENGVVQALINSGPEAEDAVLDQLKLPNLSTPAASRIDATSDRHAQEPGSAARG